MITATRPLTIGDLYERAVLHGGDETALVEGEKSMTYAEVGRQAEGLLGSLQALGLGPGDRVAFLMKNCLEYVVCEYALAMAGVVRVPLAVLLGNEDHIYMMNFTECKALIYHEALADRVRAMAPHLETVEHWIVAAEESSLVDQGHLHLQTLIEEAAGTGMRAEVEPEDLASIYFTGGTTGRPKGVMLSHRSWFYTYYVEMLDFDIAWGERLVMTTPMTHAAGCLILPVLLRRGRCVLVDHFDPDLLLSTIERERATATLVVPTMIYALLDHPGRDRYDVASLCNVLYGAAAIAPQRLREAIDVFGPVFTQFYGQTEAPMALTALSRELHVVDDPQREEAVLSSAGLATYQTKIRLMDDEGNEVPLGQPGEIVARSPNVMSGYYRNPEATAETVVDGWLYTGDIARMDANGFITIVDRKKDMIVSGGFNVFPREVEDVLFEHPAVRQAAVVGVPHEKWGEEVRAVVVLHPGAEVDAGELIEFVKSRKGSVMAPKTVEFRETIPVTNLGKVDRKAIRAAFWSGRDRMV